MGLHSMYRARPRPSKEAKPVRSARENEQGLVILDPTPHPDLLSGAKPISLADQVYNLERLSMLRRKSYFDNLAEDDFADDIDGVLENPLTPYELAGMPKEFSEQPQAPAASVSGREEPTKQAETPPSGE